MSNNEQCEIFYLPIQDVRRRAGCVSKSTLYLWIKAGHFPKGRKLGPRRVGWLATEVEAWAKSKAAA